LPSVVAIELQRIEMHGERAVGRHQVADAFELQRRQRVPCRHHPRIQCGVDPVTKFQRQRAVTEIEQSRVHPTMRCGSQVMMPGKA
jgi:hypothetical protein